MERVTYDKKPSRVHTLMQEIMTENNGIPMLLCHVSLFLIYICLKCQLIGRV